MGKGKAKELLTATDEIIDIDVDETWWFDVICTCSSLLKYKLYDTCEYSQGYL